MSGCQGVNQPPVMRRLDTGQLLAGTSSTMSSFIHPCHGTGSRKDGCMSSSPGLTRSVSVHLFVLYISSGPSNMFSADKNVSAMGLCRKVLKICTLLALEKDLLHFQSIYNLHIDLIKIVFSGLPSLIIADRFRYIYYQRIELTVSIRFI